MDVYDIIMARMWGGIIILPKENETPKEGVASDKYENTQERLKNTYRRIETGRATSKY